MTPKVLMFGWEFPPYNNGGLGTACEGLTRALAACGVQTTFVLPKKVPAGAPFLKKMLYAGIENFTMTEVPSLLYPYITSEAYRELVGSMPGSMYGANLLAEVRLYGERARAIARREQFNIIHAHDWLAYPAGLAAQEVSHRPLVVHVHATEFDRGGGNGVNAAVYAIEKEGMERADRILAVSQWTKDLVTHQYDIPESKITVVHNGVTAGDYERRGSNLDQLKRAGNKIILFVGRITLQKGPDYFVQTAKQVLHYRPNTYFVMVGSGDMQGQVMQTAAYLGISDKFIFPGFVRGEELNKIYQAADLYILPSVSEPFGITPLESLANGTPVMVSKQSGVAEVLSHALKTDFWDVDEMTNQILAVLEHRPLQETLAANGADEVHQITWTNAAKKVLGVYNELLLPSYAR